jgi:hypothetical protein
MCRWTDKADDLELPSASVNVTRDWFEFVAMQSSAPVFG